jgi:hypothetical protein
MAGVQRQPSLQADACQGGKQASGQETKAGADSKVIDSHGWRPEKNEKSA